jgi:hypothetical protein
VAAYYDPGSTASHLMNGAEVVHVGGATIIVLSHTLSHTSSATATAYWSKTLWDGWERREPRRLELPEFKPFAKAQKYLARKLTFRTYVRQIPRSKQGKARSLPRAMMVHQQRREMVWRVRGIARDP